MDIESIIKIRLRTHAAVKLFRFLFGHTFRENRIKNIKNQLNTLFGLVAYSGKQL